LYFVKSLVIYPSFNASCQTLAMTEFAMKDLVAENANLHKINNLGAKPRG